MTVSVTESSVLLAATAEGYAALDMAYTDWTAFFFFKCDMLNKEVYKHCMSHHESPAYKVLRAYD